MKNMFSKKFSRLAAAATVIGASFGVAPANAQYLEYNKDQCPVIDTDLGMTQLKMGIVNALNAYRVNNSLLSGYVCPDVNSQTYYVGVHEAQLCVDDYVSGRINVNRLRNSFKYQAIAPTTARDVQRTVERAVDRCHYGLFARYPNSVWR